MHAHTQFFHIIQKLDTHQATRCQKGHTSSHENTQHICTHTHTVIPHNYRSWALTRLHVARKVTLAHMKTHNTHAHTQFFHNHRSWALTRLHVASKVTLAHMNTHNTHARTHTFLPHNYRSWALTRLHVASMVLSGEKAAPAMLAL